MAHRNPITSNIPRLTEISPVYGGLLDRRESLRSQLEQLENDARELDAVITGHRPLTKLVWAGKENHPDRDFGGIYVKDASSAPIVGATARSAAATENEREIYALLGTEPPPPPGPTPQDQLMAMLARCRHIREALKILDRQIFDERSAASAKLCELVEHEHETRLVKVCKAMISLLEADREYRKLTDRLADDGVLFARLRPQFPAMLDCHRERYTRAQAFLNQAVRYGHLQKSAIPKELRS